MKSTIPIPIPGSRKIQSRLERSKRGQYKFRVKFGPRKIDKILSSSADNKEDAAEDIIQKIRDLNDPGKTAAKTGTTSKTINRLHSYGEIFSLYLKFGTDGDKQKKSSIQHCQKIIRGIGLTEEAFPHQSTKDLCEIWHEEQVGSGKDEEEKHEISRLIHKTFNQTLYGVFKEAMLKHYNLGPNFDLRRDRSRNLPGLKVKRFKMKRYTRPTDNRHDRCDLFYNLTLTLKDDEQTRRLTASEVGDLGLDAEAEHWVPTRRDFGFYKIMRITGQRNIEVTHQKRENVQEDGFLNDRIVSGKNEEARFIPFPIGFTEEERQFLLTINPDSKFLLPGTDWDRTDGYSERCNSHCKKFGFNAYDLRKEFACDLLDAGLPIQEVADYMGNSVAILVAHYVAPKQTRFSLPNKLK
jgi:integrase